MQKSMKILLAVSIFLAISLSGICFAKDATTSDGTGNIPSEEFNKISENIQTVLNTFPKAETEALLKIDVTYQPSLPAKISLDLFDHTKARNFGVGVYVADAFYSALFGKTEEMSAYLLACKKIIDDEGLRNIIDFDRMPKEDLAFLENPGAMTQEDLDRILVKVDEQIPRVFKKLATDPRGVEPVVDVSFGMAVETLYLMCQVVLQSDGATEAIAALANEQRTVEYALELINAVEVNDYLKTICEADEKRMVLAPVLALFQKKSGHLTLADAKTVLGIVAPVRQKMVTGQLKGHDHEHDHAS